MKFVLIIAIVISGVLVVLGAATMAPVNGMPEQTVADGADGVWMGSVDLADEGDVFSFLPVVMSPALPHEGPVTLVAPADRSQLDTLIPLIVFESENIPENTGGCLSLATEPDPTNCWSNFNLSSNRRWEWVMWFNLDPDTTYYWRVGAVYDYDYDNIDWVSQQWSFTTGPDGGVIPPAPELLSPADGDTVFPETITLQWAAVNGAQEYIVRLQEADGAGGYIVDGIYPPDTTAGADDLGWIFNSAEGPDFVWSVAARNDYAWGDWATYWNFTLGETSRSQNGKSAGALGIMGTEGVERFQPAQLFDTNARQAQVRISGYDD